mgnify:FL=1
MKYKWSMFTYHVKSKEGIIIYNFINHGAVLLEDSIYKSILCNQNDYKAERKKLIKQEFIVPIEADEKELFMNSLLKEWNNCGFLGLHILTTTGCNFKCPYCYQCGIKANHLKEENLNKEIEFLDKYIKDNNIHECRIEITGGEPTINWGIVEKMLPSLKKIFKKNKVKYETLIVTNGLLLTKEKADLLAKYNWQRLQLTIDGVENIHNKRRVNKGKENSFKTIIKNLDYVIFNNKINKVNLRINYDNSNIDSIPQLLDFLKERYGTEKLIISLGLITKTVDDANSNLFIEKNGINENEFKDAYIKLYTKLKEKGFTVSDIFSFDGLCTAKLKHGFLLQPDGKIIKCVSGVGREEFIIGDYLEGNISDENYLYPELYKECLDKECPFLPICHTGCRFDAYIKNKDKRKNNCKRVLLEEINSELLKINYERKD